MKDSNVNHRILLARFLTVAVVILLAGGAFYVAFAQSYSAGTYQDSSCSSASTTAFTGPSTGQVIYVLFELPGPGEGVGYLANSSSTFSTVSLDSVSSTCLGINLTPGTYTAYLLSSTGTATTITSTVDFTVFSLYTVAAYSDPSCAGSPASLFPAGGNVYVVIAGPASPGTPWYGFVESGTTTYPGIEAYTGLTSTSTCLTLSLQSAGTYTGLITNAVGSGSTQSTETPASTNFTVSSSVPELPMGILPLLAILPLVYLFFLLRSKAKRAEAVGPGK